MFFSDNATQFQAADKHFQALHKAIDFTKIERYRFDGDAPIKWKYSTPNAAFTNGVTERMCGLLKKQLRIALQRELVSFRTLETLVLEMQKVINDRPLSTTRSDPDELIPITPNKLIFGRNLNEFVTPEISEMKEIDFTNTWVKRKQILSGFWGRWKKDYVEQLSFF